MSDQPTGMQGSFGSAGECFPESGPGTGLTCAGYGSYLVAKGRPIKRRAYCEARRLSAFGSLKYPTTPIPTSIAALP